MHALRFFAVLLTLVGSSLFLTTAEEAIHAQVQDDAVLLVNIYAPTDSNEVYTVETLPVHAAAETPPTSSRNTEKISLAILFIVIGYSLHVISVRTPLLATHWKKYLQISIHRKENKHRRKGRRK